MMFGEADTLQKSLSELFSSLRKYFHSNVIENEQKAHNHFTASDSKQHCCAINSGSRGVLDKWFLLEVLYTKCKIPYMVSNFEASKHIQIKH